MPTLRMFHGPWRRRTVEAEYRPNDGTEKTVWLLYRFEGERLVEAVGFDNETQARSFSSRPASG